MSSEIGVASTYTRAGWELARLEDFTKDLIIDDYDCIFTDKGLIKNDYVSEFIISPIRIGFKSLNEIMGWLRDMATPPDLSNC